MDIIVLSDVHGNYVALEECIKYAVDMEINTFVFLGDYLGELAYPQKTMEILYCLANKYNCHFIRGNKEDYWLNYRKNCEKGWRDKDSTTGSLLYTYNNLTEKDITFFQGLLYKGKIDVEGMPQITICHGSPDTANKKLLPNNESTFKIMDNNENKIILCGHTHVQCKIEHNGKIVLNPGSVGVALHGAGKAQFMILHGQNNNWTEEFISIYYDVEKVIYDLHNSGLSESAPYWCKVTENLLLTGEISHGSVLARALKYCSEDRGFCNWPDIPEMYWEMAVKEMII
jgi:putative phosphoesterase